MRMLSGKGEQGNNNLKISKEVVIHLARKTKAMEYSVSISRPDLPSGYISWESQEMIYFTCASCQIFAASREPCISVRAAKTEQIQLTSNYRSWQLHRTYVINCQNRKVGIKEYRIMSVSVLSESALMPILYSDLEKTPVHKKGGCIYGNGKIFLAFYRFRQITQITNCR